MHPEILQRLTEKDVRVPHPDTVVIEDTVALANIAPGTILHPGCRLAGTRTAVGLDCELGAEAPLTLIDCQLGREVSLSGGYAEGAVFLDGARVGPCAHIRPGTIMEEQSSAAHSVGLKQTLLMPYVTLGSLINFCDCLMAGGTGPRNHSEVGSSYVHFNFTPHQDKATASLLGDVPHGVLLREAPIFLGGQGGLVGPCRVAYGTVIAAGTVYRRDVEEPDQLVFGRVGHTRGRSRYVAGHYGDITRTVRNGMRYIGNTIALREWYRHVRAAFFAAAAPHGPHCLDGALSQLDAALKERLKRMKQLAEKMERSLELAADAGVPELSAPPYRAQRHLRDAWPRVEHAIKTFDVDTCAPDERRTVTAAVPARGADYIAWVRELPEHTRTAATAWLQGIVDGVAALWRESD